MSVYGRKMFKRNARETLNQTAGIKNLPAQKFQAGGAVTPAQKTAFKGMMNRTPGQVLGSNMRFLPPMARDADPMLNLTARQALEGGIGSLSTSQLAYLQGQYEKNKAMSALGEPQPGEAAAASISRDILSGLGQASGMLQGLVVSPFMASRPDPNIFGGELAAQTPDKQFLESIGYQFYTPQTTEEAAAKAQQMRQGPARLTGSMYPGAMLAEEEAKRDTELTDIDIPNIDMPLPNQEPPQVPYAPDRSAVPTDAATTGADATAQAAGEEAAVATPEDREAVREAGTFEKEYASPKEEITRVINEGTPEEQEKTLDDFVKEFMDKAPGYEGTNQGLILAKMGFAMAAGKSSRAIENISSALEQGAEDLIKDSNKKAEFDRQLKLSALQYGLTETGKLDAQRRADDRNFIRLVDGDGNAHRISMTEILANDGKLPEGLQDVDIYLSQEKAALERLDAIKAQSNALREELLISDEQASRLQGDYSEAAKIYVDAEVGMEFAEKAILKIADDGSITGIQGGIKDLSNKLANAMGLDAPPSFQSKDEYRTFVNQAFQRLIPVSLGGVQSANSISNRDVEFLANAYVDATSLEQGSWSLVFADENILAQKLQFTIDELRKSQALAAGQMRSIEDRLTNRILPGEGLGSGLSLISEQKQSVAPYTSSFGQRSTTGLVDTGRKNDQGMPIYSFAE